MKGVEAAGKCLVGLRDANEVNMVWHQAIRQDLDGVAGSTFPKADKVVPEISVLLEDTLTIVPPLGDLVWVTDDGGAGKSGHLNKLPPKGAWGRQGD